MNTTTSETRLPQRLVRRVRIQWKPNAIPSEKRICLTRIRWENKNGPGIHEGYEDGYSAKLSVSLCYVPEDFWVGVFWKRRKRDEITHRGTLYICLIPCFPIRIKLVKSWGGIFP